MTNPGGASGLTPGAWGITGTDGSIPAKSAQTQPAVTQHLQDTFTSNNFPGLGGGLIALVLSFIGAAIAAILGGFATVLDAIFGSVNDDYIAGLPTITNHSNSITTLRAQFNQLILQGNAIVFDSNNTYTPSEGILSIDVILIGAGGGGSSGSYDAFTEGSRSGGGGGGGGETHANIPASLLPKNGDGSFKPIQIVIGMGGAGASVDSNYGAGGGHSKFGPEVGNTGQEWLLGGGGNGGAWGAPGPIAQGGVGMIPGGNGGRGAYSNVPPTAPTSSVSAYDLHGGGGGGGAGGGANGIGTAGGAGGISPGGNPGSPGNPGSSPATIIATGGGGGGGGISGTVGGGTGAFPAGGGGGSACNVGGATTGGAGGNGRCYVIERSS